MSFIQRAFQTMHPAAQVVFLACLVLTLMAVAAFAGMLWAAGGDVAAMQSLVTSGMDALDRSDVLAMNNLNQILAFFGASWAFAALVGRGTTWGGSSPGHRRGAWWGWRRPWRWG